MDLAHNALSDDSEDYSDSSTDTRSNKYQGSTSTWRHLTEEERLLAESIDQERNEDLAVHLYNAHALERRAYDAKNVSKLKPWSSKDQWLRSVESSTSDDAKGFVPPPSWTAWPMQANLVPREGERLEDEDEDEEFTLKRREIVKSSTCLEEVLTGLALRKANDDFKSAPWDRKAPRKYGAADNSGQVDDEEAIGEAHSRAVSVAQSGMSSLPPSNMNSRATSLDRSELSMLPDNPRVNTEQIMVPVFSVDDEQSAQLLRPTVRHNLSKLDSLLMALHESRQACLKTFSDSESGLDETDDEREPPKEQKPKAGRTEGRGRPRKNITVPEHVLAAELEAARAYAAEQTAEPKKRGRGRPRKVHVPLDGETHEEMFLRIWRKQKKSLKELQSMSLEASPAPLSSAAPSPAPSISPRKRKRSLDPEPQQKLGLRDWSDILGTAAIIGFDADVLDRATKRCAAIFGESMSLTTLHEVAAAAKPTDTLVQYTPAMISDFESSDEGPNIKRARVHRADFEEVSEDDGEPSRTRVSHGRHLCPVAGCARSQNGFSRPNNLSRHLESIHRLSGEELTEVLVDSGDEMLGAIHRDGFLKPLRIRSSEKKASGGGRKLRGNGKGKERETAATDTEMQDIDTDDGSDGSWRFEESFR